MLIFNNKLSVSPLTTHLALKDVHKKISKRKGAQICCKFKLLGIAKKMSPKPQKNEWGSQTFKKFDKFVTDCREASFEGPTASDGSTT